MIKWNDKMLCSNHVLSGDLFDSWTTTCMTKICILNKYFLGELMVLLYIGLAGWYCILHESTAHQEAFKTIIQSVMELSTFMQMSRHIACISQQPNNQIICTSFIAKYFKHCFVNNNLKTAVKFYFNKPLI